MAFERVAGLDEVPPGRVKTVSVRGDDVALCNVDGQIYAIADVCTHDDGPLGAGYLLGSEIECPRHGARFDVRTGAVRCLPAVVPVSTYRIQVVGPDILVDVE